VVEDAVSDVEVVVDQVSLGQPRVRKEDLVEVREVDLSPADAHGRIMRNVDPWLRETSK